MGEGADGYEGDGLYPILDRARFACPELASVGADPGYAAERVYRMPAGGARCLHPAAADDAAAGGRAADRSRARGAGRACALQERGRDLGLQAADGRRRGGDLRAQASARARPGPLRGTPLFHIQLLLGCAAINLKRLAEHRTRGSERCGRGARGDSCSPDQSLPHPACAKIDRLGIATSCGRDALDSRVCSTEPARRFPGQALSTAKSVLARLRNRGHTVWAVWLVVVGWVW